MNKKIFYIWLMGGFGNQLFQINTGKYLLEQGINVKFVTNLIEKNFITEALMGWKIHQKMISTDLLNIDLCRQPHILPAILAKSKVLQRFSRYYPSKVQLNDLPRHIFGYFQDVEFNEKLWFDVNWEFLPYHQNTRFERVLHLRLTDANNFHDNIYYYKNVIDKVKTQKFFVCTDDKEFARTLLSEQGAKDFVILNGTLMEDFSAMVSAKELIVAPSSLSWWAAKLNKSLEKYWISETTVSQFGIPRPPEDCLMTILNN